LSYFARFGFSEVDFAVILKAFASLSPGLWIPSNQEPEWHAVSLDISRDGLIER
jgi:hypothetical protein